jgi:hypothetical protein
VIDMTQIDMTKHAKEVLATVGALQVDPAAEHDRQEAEAEREDAGYSLVETTGRRSESPIGVQIPTRHLTGCDEGEFARQSEETLAAIPEPPLTSDRLDTVKALRRIADLLETHQEMDWGFTVSVQCHTKTIGDLMTLTRITGTTDESHYDQTYFRHHRISEWAAIWGGITK